jgi:hypothetical protein
MRPTSDPDSHADVDAPDSPSSTDHVRSAPWASGPAHRTQDEPTEHFVPEQRDSEHDGHLYASDSYAEPETTVLPGSGGQHDSRHAPAGHHDNDEPTAVGVAHVDTDTDTDRDTDTDTDRTASADDAAAKADDAKAEAEEAKAEAERAKADAREPEVETVALPPAAPVAVVEPVEDRPGAFAAVPVEDRADTFRSDDTHDDADAAPTELKPGDVPVTPVSGFFAADAAQGLRDRWREAQLGFIDDPRKTVDDVKALVSEAVDQFTAAVSAQRDELDAAAGDDTEQYRVAVQRYRAFFDRLLNL